MLNVSYCSSELKMLEEAFKGIFIPRSFMGKNKVNNKILFVHAKLFSVISEFKDSSERNHFQRSTSNAHFLIYFLNVSHFVAVNWNYYSQKKENRKLDRRKWGPFEGLQNGKINFPDCCSKFIFTEGVSKSYILISLGRWWCSGMWHSSHAVNSAICWNFVAGKINSF